jgi:hypothetical protein
MLAPPAKTYFIEDLLIEDFLAEDLLIENLRGRVLINSACPLRPESERNTALLRNDAKGQCATSRRVISLSVTRYFSASARYRISI